MVHKLVCVARQAAAEGLLPDTQGAAGASCVWHCDGGQAICGHVRVVRDNRNASECAHGAQAGLRGPQGGSRGATA
jgi:hypothetical protein